jgi:type I restriction enzyme S subunit
MSSEALEESAWPRVPLRDLVDERGITYGIVQPGQPTADGVPIVRVNNLGSTGLKLDDVMRVDVSLEARYGRSRLKGGEVLITIVGSVGNVVVVPAAMAGWNVARAIGVIPLRPEVPARWVAWCLQTPEARHYLDARLNTTVQKTLNLRDLAAMEVPMPPREVADAMGSVLAALEDKIESNRRLVSLLDELASVHFMRLFPGIWSDDRDAVPFDDIVAVLTGGTPKTSEPRFWDGTVPWISVKDLQPGPYVIRTERRVTPEAIAETRLRTYSQETVVISARGTVGVVALTASEMAFNQSCFGLRGKDPVGPYVTFQLARSAADLLRARSHGSVFSTITRSTFSSLRVRLPDASVIRAYESATAPIYAAIRGHLFETERLATLRDLLLPSLMSGALSVDAALRVEPEALSA